VIEWPSLIVLSHRNQPLVGPRSIKTKAKLLPPPEAQPLEDNRRRKSRKRSPAIEGYEVESGIRKAATWSEDGEAVRQLLPVKTKRGLVQQTAPAGGVSGSSSENEEDEGSSPPDPWEDPGGEVVPGSTVKSSITTKPQNAVEVFVSREQKLTEKKTIIAVSANKILENPEGNIGLLKTLKTLCMEKDPQVAITTRKLAMISFAEVIKDIAPGYE
jgi:hypothetical protein